MNDPILKAGHLRSVYDPLHARATGVADRKTRRPNRPDSDCFEAEMPNALHPVGDGPHSVLLLYGRFGDAHACKPVEPWLSRERFAHAFMDYRGADAPVPCSSLRSPHLTAA
ncbi:hypothetical protein [Burkholderia sp. Nafp2/4-1b]|uniref:hypothetical protein n=1 Tax=Burkholderia sp. Nafp2/4-1b TaxID=2116686 RepID=UPI001F08C1E1|nr:hypothetical protein [Burkholderia sp. Nafp2/4-1b]